VEQKLAKLNQKQSEKSGKEFATEEAQKKVLETKKEEIARHFEQQAAQAQQVIQQQALLAQQQQVEKLKGAFLLLVFFPFLFTFFLGVPPLASLSLIPFFS
jgi:glutaredoxin 2